MGCSFACAPFTWSPHWADVFDFGTGSRGIGAPVTDRRCDGGGPDGCIGDNSFEADFPFGFDAFADAFATRRLLLFRESTLFRAFATRRLLPGREGILLCAMKRLQELAKS